jgi:hypothetical protein
MPDRKYNLTSEEAANEMDAQLAKMRADTNREQLKELSADDAFEKGYEIAIFDLRHFIGPDPRTTN